MRFVLSLMFVLFSREGTAERPQRGSEKQGQAVRLKKGGSQAWLEDTRKMGSFPCVTPSQHPNTLYSWQKVT